MDGKGWNTLIFSAQGREGHAPSHDDRTATLSDATTTDDKRRAKSAKSTVAKPTAKGRSRRGKGPGRPGGVSNVRDEILDAAEIEFADSGYKGTSLRNVADRAKVTQALINYYFGSKEGLFREVYTRRGKQISDERSERFALLRKSGKAPKIRDVIEAFLLPALKMREMAGGRTFMRLNARLHTEPPEISYKLRTDVYDKSTRVFAEILREALPHLSAKDAYWRTTLVVGAYLYAFSDTHRLDVMAPGVCNPNDHDEVLDAITAFVTGGMLAPATNAGSAAEKRLKRQSR
jgi:AcrR family transcriptional regulator